MTATTTMPPGACDCHVHIYDARFALAPTATFTPPDAPLAAYRSVQQALALQRVVLVQPTGYGFDNRCLPDALAQPGDSARGMAVVPQDVSDTELERLHAAGIRGVRFMLLPGAGGLLPWSALPSMAARIAPLGWAINLQLDGRDLPQHRALIDSLPCKVVIDHTGKFVEPVAPASEPFGALLGVLERESRWVKLAAPYETSRSGAPPYADVAVLAQALLREQPSRCARASNWPHPNRVPPPSNHALLQLLHDWAPDAALRARAGAQRSAGLRLLTQELQGRKARRRTAGAKFRQNGAHRLQSRSRRPCKRSTKCASAAC